MSRIANGIINAIFGASAGAGDAVDPTSIFSTGWPAAYEDPASGLFPEREYFNFLLRALYSIGKDVNTHGILEWSNAVDYTHPAVVLGSDNEIYKSLQNSGPAGAGAKDPISETAYWKRISGAGIAIGAFNTSTTTVVTGFEPSVVIFLSAPNQDGQIHLSLGFDDGTNHKSVNIIHEPVNGTKQTNDADYSIHQQAYDNDPITKGYISAKSSTGFTLTWDYTGYTTNGYYLAIL